MHMYLDMYLSRVLLVYLTFLTAKVNSFDWKDSGDVRWAFNCDWNGGDIGNVQVRGEDCGGKCVERSDCTRFTWTNYKGGTCWLKSGDKSERKAVAKGDSQAVCGYRKASSNGNKLVSYDQFKQAVVDCGFPAPSQDQYDKCVSQANKGLISSRRELAMFVANIIQESGGMTKKVEIACEQSGCPGQYQTDQDVPGQHYYGRGYMQLSWHYNYLAASKDLYGDDRLAKNANLVSSDEGVAWATAFWFWKANVHSANGVQQGNFGATIKAINGALECNQGGNVQEAKRRFSFYQKVLARFSPGEQPVETGCYN